MTEESVREAIDNSKGRIFSVLFVKKDLTERKMICRIGVKKHLRSGDLPYDPISKGLVSVFDMEKQEYRMINLKTIINISLEVEGEVSKSDD